MATPAHNTTPTNGPLSFFFLSSLRVILTTRCPTVFCHWIEHKRLQSVLSFFSYIDHRAQTLVQNILLFCVSFHFLLLSGLKIDDEAVRDENKRRRRKHANSINAWGWNIMTTLPYAAGYRFQCHEIPWRWLSIPYNRKQNKKKIKEPYYLK